MTRAIFSNRASADVENIWRYTFRTWGPTQADGHVEDLIRTCDALALGARQGRPEPVFTGMLKYPVGKHIVVYEKIEGGVRIVRILHQRMDMARHLDD